MARPQTLVDVADIALANAADFSFVDAKDTPEPAGFNVNDASTDALIALQEAKGLALPMDMAGTRSRAGRRPHASPHTSRAVSTTSRSLAISPSTPIVLPPMPLEKPHCGLRASCSSGA